MTFSWSGQAAEKDQENSFVFLFMDLLHTCCQICLANCSLCSSLHAAMIRARGGHLSETTSVTE